MRDFYASGDWSKPINVISSLPAVELEEIAPTPLPQDKAEAKFAKWWRTCAPRLRDDQRDFINDLEASQGKLPTSTDAEAKIDPKFLMEQQSPTELASSFGTIESIQFPKGRGAQLAQLKKQLQVLLGAKTTQKLKKIVNRKRKTKGTETEEEVYRSDPSLHQEAARVVDANNNTVPPLVAPSPARLEEENASLPEEILKAIGEKPKKGIYQMLVPEVCGSDAAKEQALTKKLAQDPTLKLPRSKRANVRCLMSHEWIVMEEEMTEEEEAQQREKTKKKEKKRGEDENNLPLEKLRDILRSTSSKKSKRTTTKRNKIQKRMKK